MDNLNWIPVHEGTEYCTIGTTNDGTVGKVAQGKIPLTAFAGLNIENIRAYFWDHPFIDPKTSKCDEGSRYFTDTPPPTCTYTYSPWSACQPNGTQTRTVISSTPENCQGIPILSQSCNTQLPIAIQGSVGSIYGIPISGARVEQAENPSIFTITAANGSYERASYTILSLKISKEGYVTEYCT